MEGEEGEEGGGGGRRGRGSNNVVRLINVNLNVTKLAL